MEDDFRERRFYAVSYEEDIPRPGRGMLIPYRKALPMPEPSRLRAVQKYVTPALLVITSLVCMFAIGSVGLQTYVARSVAALPAVSVVNPITDTTQPLTYGIQVSLSEPTFFAETRDAFIDEEITFIEVDLSEMLLRYFVDGVLTKNYSVLAKGDEGSWWETPSGLYAVETKKERYFSNLSQTYHPWSLVFQGNFIIQGWPESGDGTPVTEEFATGGIRLSDTDAAELFSLVAVDTPVLVHDIEERTDTFLYEPKVPDLATPHYLIADVESSTVLAASELEVAAPIASLTKLMTALVAAERIDLDTTVYASQPTFVQSLIPRLGERNKVSMYSLLQLLLVESSNEAAEVIAAQLGREAFIGYMNEKAKSIGLTKTYFADPSGLSAENTASLRDLLRLTQYIYDNRRFIFDITVDQDLKTAHVSGEFGALSNFNEIEGIEFLGGKVGETIAAGQTSITLHRLRVRGQDRLLAIIILGSKERNSDVTALYEYAQERFGG